MKFTHKKIDITVDENDGKFAFVIKGNHFKVDSLYEAKNIIDNRLAEYYRFTKKDFENLLKKLDEREADCIRDIVEKFAEHAGNPYCDLGVNTTFDLSDLIKDFNR